MSDPKGASLPGVAEPPRMTATEAQTAGANEQLVVKAMAIALFEVMEEPGMSPWEPTPIPDSSFGRGFRIGEAWELYARQARAQFMAYRTMMNVCRGSVPHL